MSLPSNVQSALDALNTVGARVKAAKESGDDVTSILEEYKTLQAALSDVVRPLADSNKGSEFFWNVIAPVLERVMDKPERKKHDKEKKKWKKAVAAGGAPAAPGAPAAAPAAPAPAAADGEKKVSKSELKRIEKAKKKAAAKAKNAAAKMAEAAKMADDLKQLKARSGVQQRPAEPLLKESSRRQLTRIARVRDAVDDAAVIAAGHDGSIEVEDLDAAMAKGAAARIGCDL